MEWPARIPATRMINHPAVAKNEMPEVLDESAIMMCLRELKGNLSQIYTVNVVTRKRHPVIKPYIRLADHSSQTDF